MQETINGMDEMIKLSDEIAKIIIRDFVVKFNLISE